MDFYKIIKQRETLRNYNLNRKISNDVLMRILNAGRLAPSAGNRQPWTFILVSSEKKLNAVKTCYNRAWFQNAPHILIVVGDKTKSWIRPYDGYNSIETDLAIAMDHIILAAENENVGACWIIAFDYAKLAKVIGLKENEVVYCITPLGYPPEGYTKKNNKQRKALNEIVKKI